MRRPPHAPFLTGAPRFTPALRPIHPDDWLRPDTEAHVLDWKSKLLADGRGVYRQAPAAGPAAEEAASAVEAALGTPETGDLLAASARVSDDLVVMEAGAGGWVCTALTLTAPTFFNIDAVFGRDLRALHGPVPEGERLSRRIGRIFDHVRPGQVLERFNWTLQPGDARHTPDAAPLRALARSATPEDGPDLLHLRVERQTVSRLPSAGAALFTIRVCIDPVAALPAHERPALAAAWRALGPTGRGYKGWDALEPLAGALFARWGV